MPGCFGLALSWSDARTSIVLTGLVRHIEASLTRSALRRIPVSTCSDCAFVTGILPAVDHPKTRS